MDAFKLHQQVIDNYRNYIKSFISIKDKRIKDIVEKAFEESGFIPKPLIQFNPSFDTGEKLEDLVNERKVHTELPSIFGDYNLYKHQVEALKIGIEGKGFVVTSGTGSGKSLTYLATIFNHLLENQKTNQKGIKAILVYPMNALINSQEEEIKKYELNYLLGKCPEGTHIPVENDTLDKKIEFLQTKTDKRFPFTYSKYTGQEDTDARKKAESQKPDIILTNYMMLELIMTRQSEEWLRDSLKSNLQFLVFDELHTYRGRQGSDVSLLIRRIKYLAKKNIVSIGTSATMATGGTKIEKQQAVADVAETIFGDHFDLSQIIGEYLITCTNPDKDIPNEWELQEAINKGINIEDDGATFFNNSIAIWLENRIALHRNEDGFMERGMPKTLSAIANELKKDSGISDARIQDILINVLLWAEKLNVKAASQNIRKSYLPYRFHQFISQTNTVYVTLDKLDTREISIKSGRYVKDENDNGDKFIYPVLFSRYSGHEFICVTKNTESNTLNPRDPSEAPESLSATDAKKMNLTASHFSDGYLIIPQNSSDDIWSDENEEELPDNWYKEKKSGRELLPFYSFQVPHKIYFDKMGRYSSEPIYDQWGWFVSAKLRIDPTAGVVYEDPKTNENTKLMRLGNEGRSTATTIMSYSVIDSLNQQGELLRNQKLLSFTDNRQDASLQAGHFNDFLTTVRLRSAVYYALKDNPDGLKVHEIPQRSCDKLNLKENEYAENPNDEWPDEENERALKDFLLIRILYDLKRGWRYVLPNLEQCALLKIEYEKLSLFCKQEQFFNDLILFNEIEAGKRKDILIQVLDFFRTSYAINHPILLEQRREKQDFINLKLDNNKLWSLDKNEKIDASAYLVSQNPGKTFKIYTGSIGPMSNLGKYFKRVFKENELEPLKRDDYVDFINSLCQVLQKGNFLKPQVIKGDKGTVIGYQLRSDKVVWKLGDGKTVDIDKVRTSSYRNLDIKPNSFFKELYVKDFTAYQKPIVGREHTGQMSSDIRIEREAAFRSGEISAMFCSPTMELGIDISDLNIVHMRNVPPNPANYAQRSGRAGRSGQTALVFTYCSAWSPHDRNYFEVAEKMVAGIVVPPRIDLRNEELIRSHFNAYMLMQLGLEGLNVSVEKMLDLSKLPDMPLLPEIRAYIEDQQQKYKDDWVNGFRNTIEQIEPLLRGTHWYNDSWLERQAATLLTRFDDAFNRWRILYRNAKAMIEKAHSVLNDPTVKNDSEEGREAKRQYNTGLNQVSLLCNEKQQKFGNNSEFYIFRYLASEAFLPGYNFTRLPVRVFVGYKHQDQGEYISRSRFVALKEFGPQNLIYHNGSKYAINRMMLMEAEAKTRTIKISKQTGYAFLDEDTKTANNDPITKAELKGEKNVEVINRILEISESEGKPRERISCEEEERTSQGFKIDQYFGYAGGIESTRQSIIKAGNSPLLNVIFGPSTDLIQLNRKWKRSKDDKGFSIDNRSGRWLRQTEVDKPDIKDHVKEVMLFARNTADSLYLQPVKELGVGAEQIITLSYALKRGIERLFQTEENEIGVWVMGNPESPNIMIYEAAEGSLGILSQVIENPARFKKLFVEAYQVLHFDPETRLDTRPELPKANYEDILSYYNQTHHDVLDRFSIKEALEKLMDCTIETQGSKGDRQEQYEYLVETYDKNSSTELPLIKYLYNKGYALPDIAQHNIQDYYISADFVYKTTTGAVLVFCDGSVHDEVEQKKQDEHKRQKLRDAGFDVIEWHYTEPVEELVKRRKDVFRKIC
ncbi:DEAD/DEAH box helicase [uncultured Draconibacterium sp.]|uniref:DEAD/DEAH box helicase n=1 Tax=uncultured Draconibacterium sp. TaxID=1573823 RepID=UPI0032169E3A